jgi:SpoIID/LytB domain protein
MEALMRGRRVAAALAVCAVAVGLPVLGAAPPALAAGVTYYRPASGVLQLAGHGFGHGHGMSQWGAFGAAESAKTWQQIVDWYYANPALGSATGSVRVELTGDEPGSDGYYATIVKPAAGLTATDAAGHKLVVPTSSSYDKWRAVLLQSTGALRLQGFDSTVGRWVYFAPSAPTGSTIASWTGWIRFNATGGVLTLVRPGDSTVQYRDVLELDHTSGAAGVTVNVVTLEHYLYGVVPSEMPCSWTPTVGGTARLDALDAQAVAARSYASWRRNNPRTSQYQLVDNTFDQAYGGYSAEVTARRECPRTVGRTTTSASDAAVNATAKTVLVDGSGKPLFAQFSASNGGFEEAGGQTYLPSRPDAWDGVPTDSWSSHSWTASVSAAQLESAYPSIGTFTSLTVDSRENLSGVDQNGHTVGEQWGGRITSITVNGTAGSVTDTGAGFAANLGLMSPWFTVVVHRPSAPTSVHAYAGDTTATVSWGAPSSDGGGGIRGYTVTASPSISPVTVAGSTRSVTVTGLRDDISYTFSVVATNTAGSGPPASAAPVTPTESTLVHALPTALVYSTRASGGPLGAGTTRAVHVLGAGGVPTSGVVAVAVDVIGLQSSAASNFTVWPAGGAAPSDPQVAWAARQPVSRLVWVRVGAGGDIDVRNAAGSTDLLVDVEGYSTLASTAGDTVTPVAPYRLFSGSVGSGALRVVPVSGRDGVPAGASAALVHVVGLGGSAPNYVHVWSSGQAKPSVYALYAAAGQDSANSVLVPLGSNGSITVSPYRAQWLTVELEGWLVPASSAAGHGTLSVLSSTRRLSVVSVPAGGSATVSVGGGSTGLAPGAAGGVLLSLSASGTRAGYLIAYPSGSAAPAEVTVGVNPATPLAASLLTSVGSTNTVLLTNHSAAPVRAVLDLAGWSAA